VLTDEVREVAVTSTPRRWSGSSPSAGGGGRLIARSNVGTPVRRPPIEVGVDTRRLHFFDLDSGLAIYD